MLSINQILVSALVEMDDVDASIAPAMLHGAQCHALLLVPGADLDAPRYTAYEADHFLTTITRNGAVDIFA